MKFHAGDLVVNRKGNEYVVLSVSNVLNRMWLQNPNCEFGQSMVDPATWELA